MMMVMVWGSKIDLTSIDTTDLKEKAQKKCFYLVIQKKIKYYINYR